MPYDSTEGFFWLKNPPTMEAYKKKKFELDYQNGGKLQKCILKKWFFQNKLNFVLRFKWYKGKGDIYLN